jgi:hypothetical protein
MIVVALAAGCGEERCPGLTDCGGTCADLDNDPHNCGSCGHACAEGQVCVEGECGAGGCEDECPTLGAIACADPPQNGLVLCADFDGTDRCLEWGSYTPCDPGRTCADGACAGGCDDECATAGERWCEGEGYRECGEHDTDPCREWGDVVPCGAGETCSAGECSADCLDDCAEGDGICDDDAVRTCGSFDDDACLDWSPPEDCDDDQDCTDGACVDRACLDENEECVCGENQCCEGHCCPFFFICIPWDPQEDWCPNGPGPHA